MIQALVSLFVYDLFPETSVPGAVYFILLFGISINGAIRFYQELMKQINS